MRTTTSAVLLALLLSVPAAAATNVSAPVASNTTWTLAGSPYVLWGTVTVNTGVTLTIDPGVTVQNFDQAVSNGLAVDGSLVAQGTAGSRITFTRGLQRGLGLVRAGTGGSIAVDYCDFVDAQGVGGIEASFDIRHCTFSGTAFPGSGIYMVSPSGTPTVLGCAIANTTAPGLDLTLTAGGAIDSVSIVMDPAVDTSAITLTSSSPTIRNCTITGSGLAPAVFLAGNSRPAIEHSVIAGLADCAIWSASSGDAPALAGDSLSTTGTRLARVPLAGWVVRKGAVMNRAAAPAGAVVEILGSTCSATGTWPALVPGALLGGVTVAATCTLTVAPGAELRNGGGGGAAYDITVDGTIAAAGTSASPVVFTRGSAASGDRFGMVMLNSGAAGTLDWCEFRFANGVMFGGAAATVRRCAFLQGSAGLGIAMPVGDPVVTGCVFDSVPGDALTLYTFTAGTFDSLSIRHSTGNGIVLDGASPTITNSSIAGNAGWGVLCQNSANPAIHWDSVSGNAGGGVRNETAAITVNAENNWWGANSGPYHATLNPTGTGNAVSDYVDFDPWLDDGTGARAAATVAARCKAPELVFAGGVIRWHTPVSMPAQLTIHDLAGRIVYSAALAGQGALTLGRVAAAGPFVAVLRAGGRTSRSAGVIE